MTKPLITIHNTETNEIETREMTASEYKEYKTQQDADATVQAEAEAKETARAEILNRLGLTADEAAILLG